MEFCSDTSTAQLNQVKALGFKTSLSFYNNYRHGDIKFSEESKMT